MHEIRNHKYPYYFTNEDACSKWISHESRILVELWNELFERSTNSVLSSNFIVKTSHETVKSNLIYGKSGINSCQVPNNEHSYYVNEISKSGVFRGIDVGCLYSCTSTCSISSPQLSMELIHTASRMYEIISSNLRYTLFWTCSNKVYLDLDPKQEGVILWMHGTQ